MTNAALVIEGLEAGYEPGLPIVRGLSLSLQAGEILGIIGPNGAGKSTLVKAVAGLVPIFRGRVLLFGKEVTRIPAHRRVFEGLSFVPQSDNIFANLNVYENLRLAAAVVQSGQKESLGAAYALFPDLEKLGPSLGAHLSGGQRQMLAIALALIGRPKVLMLDEPSAGLSPLMVDQVFTKLRQVCDSGVSVLLVEQNVKAALKLSDRIAVLAEGRERVVAASAALSSDRRVQELYLGNHAGTLSLPAKCEKSV